MYISSQPLKVNVQKFDSDHEQLVAITNQLFAEFDTGKAPQPITPVMGKLSKLLVSHFAAEENVLAEHSYPGLEGHRLEHNKLLDELFNLETCQGDTTSAKLLYLMQFMLTMLTVHIGISDKRYGPFLNNKGLF